MITRQTSEGLGTKSQIVNRHKKEKKEKEKKKIMKKVTRSEFAD